MARFARAGLDNLGGYLMFTKLLIWLSLASILISGCSYQVDVSKDEAKVRADVFDKQFIEASEPTDKILSYGRALSQSYFKSAGEASEAQDGGFFALLGIATWGAERALGGATSSVLGQFVVGGTAVNSAVNYVDAAGATRALIKAAEQMSCIVSAGTSASLSLENDTSANALLLAGYDRVRVTLHKALLREAPDFSTLATTLADATQRVADATESEREIRSGNKATPAELKAAEQAKRQKTLAELDQKIASCAI